jgi:hypothetical protein
MQDILTIAQKQKHSSEEVSASDKAAIRGSGYHANKKLQINVHPGHEIIIASAQNRNISRHEGGQISFSKLRSTMYILDPTPLACVLPSRPQHFVLICPQVGDLVCPARKELYQQSSYRCIISIESGAHSRLLGCIAYINFARVP